MKKFNWFMKVLIGAILGVGIGRCLFICFDYWRQSEVTQCSLLLGTPASEFH